MARMYDQNIELIAETARRLFSWRLNEVTEITVYTKEYPVSRRTVTDCLKVLEKIVNGDCVAKYVRHSGQLMMTGYVWRQHYGVVPHITCGSLLVDTMEKQAVFLCDGVGFTLKLNTLLSDWVDIASAPFIDGVVSHA